jgi:hypothetical protein
VAAVVHGPILKLMAAVVVAVAVGRRLRLVFLVFQPHIFLLALAGQALQQMLLTVQQAVRRGLINLRTPLQQYLLMVLLLKQVLSLVAVAVAEVVDQLLAQLV